MNLKGKCVLIGVTGSIAAYKMADVVSQLRKDGADVHVILTENATNFITPQTFETLSGNRCVVDQFDRDYKYEVTHVELAKAADCIMIAPATANIIAKMAHGIADDMLSTVVLASRAKKIVSPAMNTAMLENPVTQDNIAALTRYGMTVITPESGMLACRDVGAGKLPKPEVLLQYIYREIARDKDLSGKKVLVTAGPTKEAIDPVRFITNHSSGKMGYAIAHAAMLRGAEVCLIHGETALSDPLFVETVGISSAHEMYNEAVSRFENSDIYISAAAVADFRPKNAADHKIKKNDSGEAPVIELERTDDIIASLGKIKTHQFICGFAMETEDLIRNATEKRIKTNMDMIVANSINTKGAGFAGDTNVCTLISASGQNVLPLMEKEDVAHAILDEILRLS